MEKIVVAIVVVLAVLLVFSDFSEHRPIYLISLDKDVKRREKLTDVNPVLTFAVNGKDLDVDKLKEDGIVSVDCKLKKGEIGCYLSHIYMMNRALETGKSVLIIEDDVKLSQTEINQIKDVNVDADVVCVGHNYYREEYFTTKPITYLHGMHAYIFNSYNVSNEKMRQFFPIKEAIDVVLPTILSVHVVEPKIVELGEFGHISNTQGIA